MTIIARRSKFFIVAAAALSIAACESDKGEGAYQSEAPVEQPADTGPTYQRVPPSVVGQGPADGSQEQLEAIAGSRIYFGYDRYDLTAQAQQTLRDQAAWLRQHPNVTVLLEGHCDERGTREYNLALGARRANAAKRFLVSLGIDPNRVRTISYGKERPEALGSNEAAWAQNRRGVTVVQ